MTVARTISRSVAEVVERLELDGDIVVTVERIRAVMDELGLVGDPRRVAYRLQADGWLGSLRTRHTWEFLPGARGGAFGSGDRFIEVRAQMAARPEWPGVVAMESAATLLGLAQRIPEQEVVALPDGERFPRALTGDWRYVRVAVPAEGTTTNSGLHTWNHEGLLVGIGARPSGYQDVPGLGQWLSTSPRDADVELLISLLSPMSAPTRQRTAYLVLASGNIEAARRIMTAYPSSDTAWLGPRRPGGRYDPLTKVSDTVLHQYLTVGVGL